MCLRRLSIFLIISWLGRVCSLAETSPALPDLSNYTVTLPYAEVKALWQAAQSPSRAQAEKPGPPVTFSVQSMRCAVAVSDDGRQVSGEAVYEVLDFADGWMSVPLLQANDMRVCGVESAGAVVTVENGSYALLVNKPGNVTVTLRFSAEVAAGGGGRRPAVCLPQPLGLVNTLTVSKLPDGWLPKVDGATPIVSEKGPAVFQLTPNKPVVLSLVPADEEKPPAPLQEQKQAAPLTSIWRAEAQSLVAYDDGRLIYKTRLRANTESGAGLAMSLTLAAHANLISLTSDDLDRWQMSKSDAAETRRIDLYWKTADVPRREIVLVYEIPQLTIDSDWRLTSPGVSAESGRLENVEYFLPAVEGIEMLAEDGSPLATGESARLPRWLAGELGHATFATLSSKIANADDKGPGVKARRLPLVHTAKAAIDDARFLTRLVADGALLTEGEIAVRHEEPLSLGLALPEGAQLLTCSVDGRAVSPVDRGTGRIEIPLPATVPGKPNSIALSYTGRTPPLAPVAGQATLSLPETDLLVQTLLWNIQIPDAYELTAMEGNVEMMPSGAPNSGAGKGSIHLRKELLKSERPHIAMFYQKRSAKP